MPDYAREDQKQGRYTPLEQSQKEFHDKSIELIEKQLVVIEEQRIIQARYGRTIRQATIWTAIATVLMATIMAVSYFFPIRQTVVVPTIPTAQQQRPQK